MPHAVLTWVNVILPGSAGEVMVQDRDFFHERCQEKMRLLHFVKGYTETRPIN